MGASEIESAFPKIRKEGYRITSHETTDYNCFAWAVEDASKWWSPDSENGYYWPEEVPKKLDVASFAKLYEHHGGYIECDNPNQERGFEKIAIYVNDQGEVTHAARQINSGKWTSKLGDWEDIEHDTLIGLEGEFYGRVAQILKRAL